MDIILTQKGVVYCEFPLFQEPKVRNVLLLSQGVERVFNFYSVKIKQIYYSFQGRGLAETRGPD